MAVPTDFTNQYAWFKSDVGVYSDAGTTAATNGTGVQEWHCQFGSGRKFTQTTAANKPTFTTGVVNSLPALRFDASNDGMAGFTTMSGSHTLFLCYAAKSTAGARRMLCGTDGNWLIGGPRSDQFGGHAWHASGWVGSSNDNANSNPLNANEFVIVAARRDTAAPSIKSSFFVNGYNRTTNSGLNTIPSAFALATSGLFGETANADLVEIIMYDAAMSDADIVSLTKYMAMRYALWADNSVDVTQLTAEALVAGTPSAQVSQLVSEALVAGDPAVQITQFVVEILIPAPGGDVRVTRVAGLMPATGTPARVTRMAGLLAATGTPARITRLAGLLTATGTPVRVTRVAGIVVMSRAQTPTAMPPGWVWIIE